MSKFFYNYKIWECKNSNFYLGVRSGDVNRALDIMRDSKVWGLKMKRLLDRWPVSCNQSLSDNSINKKAWIGQASMACFYNISAATTKKCWFLLSEEEKLLANKKADLVYKLWRLKCQSSVQISMF